MTRRTLKRRTWTVLGLCLLGPVLDHGATESVLLRYTYKKEQAAVGVLRDVQGKAYLPLLEVARFYGVKVDFDAQTRRVSLEKGAMRAKGILSQPVFLMLDPDLSIPIDPLEVVSGQLAVSPDAAEELMGSLLNLPVRFLPEPGALVAGGVPNDDLQREIRAHAGPSTASTPQPASSAAAGPTVMVSPAAAPSLAPTPTATQVVQAKPTARPRREQGPLPAQEYHVRRIIIDAGHGGYDTGAPSKDRHYFEKQATLDMAQKVAELLRKEYGLEVFMTRRGDYYITLKYRTDFANSHHGDLFVSIHCNSNPRPGANGTEIYCYSSKASNRAAERAALRENMGNDYTQFILNDLHTKGYEKRSRALAEEVQTRVVDRLGQHKRTIQTAPFYVLCRADMPSILVETAFISNPKEVQKLRDPYWRDKMAKAIADGIIAYKDRVEGLDANQQARR